MTSHTRTRPAGDGNNNLALLVIAAAQLLIVMGWARWSVCCWAVR